MAETPSWIVAGFLPYEAEVRRWLRRTTRGRYDESDIVQEAYYRIWRSADPELIASPRSYFYQVARNIFLEQLRRDKMVKFADLAENDLESIPCDEPAADRHVAGCKQLAMVQKVVDELPERCRRIMRMRKVDGKSQKETALLLGVSENIVEKDVALALRHLLKRVGELEGAEYFEPDGSWHDRTEGRERG
jgi:RNA polymerase sigma factor (sigma-70 family)